MHGYHRQRRRRAIGSGGGRRSATAIGNGGGRRSATAVAGDRQRRYPSPSVTLMSLAMHLGPVYKGAQAHQLERLWRERSCDQRDGVH